MTSSRSPGPRLSIATRPSPLALHQANLVAEQLIAAGAARDVELVKVATQGDVRNDVPLTGLGGRGVFAKEVQAAVLDGRCDLAVHSAKDLTPVAVDGLVLAAVPSREDPRDALVGATLDGLAPGAPVATGSVRRRAQLAALRPDLTFCELRGNIATRLERVPRRGAIVMAYAALVRLGLADRVSEVLPVSLMLPQVAQGALAVECRAGDAETLSRVTAIEDAPARRCVDAERAFLAALGGNCDLPVGAYGQPGGQPDIRGGSILSLEAMAASGDGRILVRHTLRGGDPVALGQEMAGYMIDTAGLSETLGLARR